jgi:dienelactone hydrolase
MNPIEVKLQSQPFQGQSFRHTLVREASAEAARGLIVLVPNFMGIVPATTELAREFARPGTEVLILDVFGDNRPSNHQEAAALSESVRSDPRALTEQGRLAIEACLAQQRFGLERVSLLGFCFGGAVALELARTGLPVHAVVALHADLSTQWSADQIQHKSRVLTIQGSADPLVPMAQVQSFHQEMSRFAVEWRLTLLGGLLHAFTDPDANVPGVARYDAAGRQHSFEQARAFMA